MQPTLGVGRGTYFAGVLAFVLVGCGLERALEPAVPAEERWRLEYRERTPTDMAVLPRGETVMVGFAGSHCDSGLGDPGWILRVDADGTDHEQLTDGRYEWSAVAAAAHDELFLVGCDLDDKDGHHIGCDAEGWELVRVRRDGSRVWTVSLERRFDELLVDTTRDEPVLITRHGAVRRYDMMGQLQWETAYDMGDAASMMTADGEVVVVSRESQGETVRSAVIGVDGQLTHEAELAVFEGWRSIKVTALGDSRLAAAALRWEPPGSLTSEIKIATFDRAGHVSWDHVVSSEYGLVFARALTTTTSGDVLVTGTGPLEDYIDRGWLRRYGPDGELRWFETFDFPTERNHGLACDVPWSGTQPRWIGVDDADRVVIGGTSELEGSAWLWAVE